MRDYDFDLDLGEEVDDVLRPPIELGVPFLPPEPLHFLDRYALNILLRQRLLHFVELERLDDGFDFFHRLYVRWGRAVALGYNATGRHPAVVGAVSST